MIGSLWPREWQGFPLIIPHQFQLFGRLTAVQCFPVIVLPLSVDIPSWTLLFMDFSYLAKEPLPGVLFVATPTPSLTPALA